MLIDALNFSKSINYLLEININWDEIKSNKFLYLVPKTSLVKEHDLDIFFKKIQNLYDKLISENQELNYLGSNPKMLYKKIDIPENFNTVGYNSVAMSKITVNQVLNEVKKFI